MDRYSQNQNGSTPTLNQNYNPASQRGKSAGPIRNQSDQDDFASGQPNNEAGWIHPSHRGTNYIKKPPKKKKKKKKRTKSPILGPYGVLPNQGNSNPNLVGYGTTGSVLPGDNYPEKGAYNQSGSNSKFLFGRPPQGDILSEDRNPNGAGMSPGSDMNSDTNRGSPNRGGAAGFNRDESDRRQSDTDQNRDEVVVAAAYSEDQKQELDTEEASEDPNGQDDQLDKNIRKRRKNNERKQSEVKKNLRKQSELYVDYQKMAKIDDDIMAQAYEIRMNEVDDPDKFWEIIEPDDEDLELDPNYVGPLSYKKVKRNVWLTHPRDRAARKEFDWLEADLKHMPLSQCIIKENAWVTPCAREIGLGPTLFLFTQKAFAWIFLFFVLINIPLFMFYSSAGQTNSQGSAQSKQFTDNFGYLSLGNLGVSGYSCASVNMAKGDRTLRFNCQYGTQRNLTTFGLQKQDNQSCTDDNGYYLGENDPDYALQLDCNYKNGLSSDGLESLNNAYQTLCYNKNYCELPLMFSWFNTDCQNRLFFYAAHSKHPFYALSQNWTYYQVNAFIREPVIFGVSFCVSDQIYNPLNGNVMSIKKGNFIYIVLAIDFVVLLTSIWFFGWLELKYKGYTKIFNKGNVELRDFTIRVGNLPNDYEYDGKDLLLQAQLWNHFEKCLQNAFEYRAKKLNDQDALEQIQDQKLWEIADIVFHKNDLRESELLGQMALIDYQKKTLIRQVQLIKIDKEKRVKQAADIDKKNEQIVELVKKYKVLKAEYVFIQEQKLYEKWEMTDKNGKKQSDHSIEYAYITFKSMSGRKMAMKIFEFAASHDDTSKQFQGKYLTVEIPEVPTCILWENINYTDLNRRIRSFIVNIMAVIVVLLAFYALVRFKQWKDAIVSGAGIGTKCPKTPVTADIALDDWEKTPLQRQGFTHCFCLAIYNAKGGDISSAQAQFLEVDSTTLETPCVDWLFVYQNGQILIIIAGIFISIINTVCVMIFQMAPVLFEKCNTTKDVIFLQFTRICIIQFLNIGCIFLLSDFYVYVDKLNQTPQNKSLLNIFPFLQGKYTDFDTNWYFSNGATISFAMVTNSFVPFIGKIIAPFISMVMRYLDRGFKKHLKMITNIREQEEEEREKLRQQLAKNPPPAKKNDNEKEGGEELYTIRPKGKKIFSNHQSKNTPRKARYLIRQESVEDEDNYREGGETPGDKKKKNIDDADYEYEVGEDDAETKLVFQYELNELYSGALMEVFYPYSWFFTNLLIFYMYSGAMPIMYVLGVIHFVCGYLSYKFLLVGFFRKSHNFDEYIPLLSISMMKYALFVHLLMILFMYTNKRLLPPDNMTPEIYYRPLYTTANLFIKTRFDTQPSQTVALFVIIIIGLYIVWRIILPCFHACERYMASQRAKDLFEEEEDEELKEIENSIQATWSDNLYQEYNIKFLKNLYIRSTKEFELFRTMFNAISYDPEKLSDDQAKYFKKQLKKRLIAIEDTADIHLNLIGGLEKYLDRNYLFKIAVLYANEEKIQLKNPNCQRLQDLTQSYYIYDSIDFQRHSEIQRIIDRELLELDVKDVDAPVYC